MPVLYNSPEFYDFIPNALAVGYSSRQFIQKIKYDFYSIELGCRMICRILLFLILLPNCAGNHNNSSPIGPIPTPIVRDQEYCEAAQKNLNDLRCELGNPTKRGKSFAQFCRETQDNGVSVYPKCLSIITNCDQIDTVTTTGICPAYSSNYKK